ncbi:MAG: asparagine synthase (glutamine-hydrolyzing) [Bacteroidia bacterium]|nr:asparagine synthase (glutamine-hydrolyzing) [Bacteroidia bacterium]
MCGIAGIFSKKKVDLSLVKKMADVIYHRGPDGEGYWMNNDENLALGHRRLSIIDLSDAAKQPMHYNGRYTLTFNGEIYNYVELKKELIKEGFRFNSDSDTEVLLALYSKYGNNCLELLDGMFAFAIYDNEKDELFCARDRFGEKPFFYVHIPGKHFVFGSEIKQLFEAGISREFNEILLFNYLENPYVLSNPSDEHETFYKHVKKLPKASYVVINDNCELTEQRYWKIDLRITTKISYHEAIVEFRRLFYESITRRMRSDVPVGSSLSGGLDSSSIVCVIQELYKAKSIRQKTFSARFKNFHRDEGKFIKYVLEGKNIDAYETWPNEQDFISDLGKLMFHQDEPFPTASIYAQYCVMAEAKKQNVIVLLDGQGADEILAGYEFYLHHYLKELSHTDQLKYNTELEFMKQIHPHLQFDQSLQYKLISDYELSTLKTTLKDKIKTAIRPIYRKINPAKYERIAMKMPLNTNYNAEFFEMVAEQKLFDFNFNGNTLNNYLKYSVETYNLEDLLRFSDRNSMAHSREVRLPFLSTELVEFLFTLPSSYKIKEGWTKALLRDAMIGILPKEIERRVDKVGYEPPQANWMKNRVLQDQVQESYIKLQKEGILNSEALKNRKLDWQALNVAALLH